MYVSNSPKGQKYFKNHFYIEIQGDIINTLAYGPHKSTN